MVGENFSFDPSLHDDIDAIVADEVAMAMFQVSSLRYDVDTVNN